MIGPAFISAPDSAFPLWSQAGLTASRRGPTDVVALLVPADLFTGTDYICRPCAKHAATFSLAG